MINYNPLLEENGKIKTIYINLKEEINKSVRLEDKLKNLDFCNFRRFNAIKGSEVYNKLVSTCLTNILLVFNFTKILN